MNQKHKDFISLATCMSLNINGKKRSAQRVLNFLCPFPLMISGRWKLQNVEDNAIKSILGLRRYVAHAAVLDQPSWSFPLESQTVFSVFDLII